MELAPGVFVSSISADEWVPDPDVPGTEMHELVHDGGVSAGLTRITSVDGPITWTPEQREIVHVLEGSVRIEIADWPDVRAPARRHRVASCRGGHDLAHHDAVQGALGPGLTTAGLSLRP